MSSALLFILMFTLLPNSDKDKEKDPVVVVSMDVNLEVVSGTQFVDSFESEVEVSNSDENYQMGFREFIISYPTATEVVTEDNYRNHNSVHDQNCSLYVVSDIEKVDETTGVLRLHYLASDEEDEESNEKHVATIIYL